MIFSQLVLGLLTWASPNRRRAASAVVSHSGPSGSSSSLLHSMQPTTSRRLLPLLALSSLLLGACATPPRRDTALVGAANTATPTAATSAPSAPAPVVHEGQNYRYVQRRLADVAAENEAPYWLTSFDNAGRERVLPANNQGVALVLQAPVGVPKLVLEEKAPGADRIHLRIINRGDIGMDLEIACLTRTTPVRRYARVDVPIGGLSMIDLALDTPASDRSNLLIRVR